MNNLFTLEYRLDRDCSAQQGDKRSGMQQRSTACGLNDDVCVCNDAAQQQVAHVLVHAHTRSALSTCGATSRACNAGCSQHRPSTASAQGQHGVSTGSARVYVHLVHLRINGGRHGRAWVWTTLTRARLTDRRRDGRPRHCAQ